MNSMQEKAAQKDDELENTRERVQEAEEELAQVKGVLGRTEAALAKVMQLRTSPFCRD